MHSNWVHSCAVLCFVSAVIALDLTALLGDDGVNINGISAGEQSGYSLSWLGDVNGDGNDDFIIGAPAYSSSRGRAFVVFGSPSLRQTNGAVTFDNLNGFYIEGKATGDGFATSVSAAGDVNNDGFADFIVGAPLADGLNNGRSDSGEAYLIFGHKTIGSSGSVLLSDSNVVIVYGAAANNKFGTAVSGAGDVNGDSIDDFIGCAPGAGGSLRGQCYLIYGSSTVGASGVIDLASSLSGIGVTITGASGDRSDHCARPCRGPAGSPP